MNKQSEKFLFTKEIPDNIGSDLYRDNSLLSLDITEEASRGYDYFVDYIDIYRNVKELDSNEKKELLTSSSYYNERLHGLPIQYTFNVYRDIHKYIKQKTLLPPLVDMFVRLPTREHKAFYFYLMGNYEDFLQLLRLALFFNERDKKYIPIRICDSRVWRVLLVFLNSYLRTERSPEVYLLDVPDVSDKDLMYEYYPISCLNPEVRFILDKGVEQC